MLLSEKTDGGKAIPGTTSMGSDPISYILTNYYKNVTRNRNHEAVNSLSCLIWGYSQVTGILLDYMDIVRIYWKLARFHRYRAIGKENKLASSRLIIIKQENSIRCDFRDGHISDSFLMNIGWG